MMPASVDQPFARAPTPRTARRCGPLPPRRTARPAARSSAGYARRGPCPASPPPPAGKPSRPAAPVPTGPLRPSRSTSSRRCVCDPVVYLLLLALAQHQPRRRADLAVPVARQLHRQRALDQVARHRQPRRVRPFPHPLPFRIRAGEGMDHGRRVPGPPHSRGFRRSDAARSRKASASNMERSLPGSRSYIARAQRSRNATLS